MLFNWICLDTEWNLSIIFFQTVLSVSSKGIQEWCVRLSGNSLISWILLQFVFEYIDRMFIDLCTYNVLYT